MAFKYLPLKPGTYTVSSPFGPRDGGFHYGLDFAATLGTPFYAPVDGVIVEGAERHNVDGFGKWVWLDAQAAAGVDLIFGHGDPAVRAGDRVRAGQLLGYVNTYGQSTGPHLHLEVWTPPGRVGGRAVDPAPYFAGARDVNETTQGRTVDNPVTRIQYSDNCEDGYRNVSWIAIHTQEGDGTAASLANYLCNPASQVSYNAVVDDHETVLVVDWDTNPWSAMNANSRADHICMAGTYVRWSRGKWLETDASDGVDEDAMLTRTAALVAWRCLERGIPIEYVGGGSTPPDRPGICGHRDFGQWGGGHTDPGPTFPWDELIRRAQAFAAGQNLGDDLSFANESIKNKAGQDVNAGEMMAYLDLHINQIKYALALVLEQFAGKGAAAAFLANEKDARPAVSFPGWEQGGGRTLYDLSAATAAKAGVDGAKDKQAPKAA